MTQAEIAKKLNLSQSSVSLVVRNPETRRVSAEKKRALFDFLRNSADGTNGGRRNWCITCVLESAMQDKPDYMRFIRGIDEAISEQGYHLILKYLHNLTMNLPETDGFIFLPKIPQNEIGSILKKKPVVLLNVDIPTACYDFVCPDDEGAIFCLLNHLKKLGHTRIALFNPYISRDSKNYHERNYRKRKCDFFFKNHLHFFGLSSDSALVANPVFINASKLRTREIIFNCLDCWMKLSSPPTAILCANDFYAQIFWDYAISKGMRIPGDLSLTGIDNTTGNIMNITTIDQNWDKMGDVAGRLLLRRISHPDTAISKVMIQSQLLIGNTTGKAKRKSM